MTPPLRFHTNFDAAALRGESRCSAKAVQTRRLLVLAAIYARATRGPRRGRVSRVPSALWSRSPGSRLGSSTPLSMAEQKGTTVAV